MGYFKQHGRSNDKMTSFYILAIFLICAINLQLAEAVPSLNLDKAHSRPLAKPQHGVDEMEDNNEVPEAALANEIDALRMLLFRPQLTSTRLDSRNNPFSDRRTEDLMRLAQLNENQRRWIAMQRKLHLQRQRLEDELRPKRRGSCLFHAGLAHNCDFRDVVGAVNEASHWGSDLAPGK